ncbi:MAG: hypothetical protein LBS54_06360 [Dysgonamonadaceae bacterium]|jgi:hypothetical protein|nr:hypothetical protein [Dysgonamonadaceae bacterium]
MKKYFFIAVALLMMSAGVVKAQVTIGATTDPHSFSILELVSDGTRGLRLPQMMTTERDLLQLGNLTGDIAAKAQGLQIFNTDTKCVETWNGSKWIESCALPEEQILLTININVDGGTYRIPTSGYVGSTFYHAYDWNVSVDGGAAVRKTRDASTEDHNGIPITIPKAGTHQIRITPADTPAPGWGNAFGYKSDNTGNANTAANKDKLISINAPLTTMAFAPEEEEGNTSASNMFNSIFRGCTNLTTGAKIVDTYKLPPTVTDLSYFLANTHYGNTKLETPIDLSGLEGWLSNNTTIMNLDRFLFSTHQDNTTLKDPIYLAPLKDWFSNNNKITIMSRFFSWTHKGNTALEAPINLTHLSGWFSDNTTIMNLDRFLSNTHNNNISINLTGQIIFPNWIKTLTQEGTTPIKDVDGAFLDMFSCEEEKNGDTGEPQFEDDTDPITSLIVKLSDLGNPSSGKNTYKNRTGITSNTNIGNYWY